MSNCWSDFGPDYDVPRNYNIITIDQRGMGRSSPSFMHDEGRPGFAEDESEGESLVLQLLIAKSR